MLGWGWGGGGGGGGSGVLLTSISTLFLDTTKWSAPRFLRASSFLAAEVDSTVISNPIA